MCGVGPIVRSHIPKNRRHSPGGSSQEESIMSPFTRRLGLVAALLIVGASASDCLAQKKAGGQLKFEMYQDAGKEYRWRLKAGNGSILATAGQSYKAKADCKSSIEHVKSGAAKGDFEVYEDKAKE